MWTVPLSELDYDDLEARAVQTVIASGWLSMGPETEAFEIEFARAHEADHAVAVHSGSAALYLALRAAGVGSGDEVVLPSLTFVASAHAVLQCGAKPVFADIISDRHPLLDPADVARRINDSTRAILPVHYSGSLCDMAGLRALADRHGLALIADAAHAAGTPNVAAHADASCFSFYANKNLATGEGGMLLTDSESLAETLRCLRSHGRNNSSHSKAGGDMAPDDVAMHGINARIGELASALGRVQLQKLTAGNARRRSLRRLYAEALDGAVTIPLAGAEDDSACHLMVVALPAGCDRDSVRVLLAERGIQTSVHYPPIHRFSAFAEQPGDAAARPPLTVTEELTPRLLTLPLHARLTDAQVSQVSEALLAAPGLKGTRP
jgi:dTDP-4-amino-4,6-dideoxygalactose transaminase